VGREADVSNVLITPMEEGEKTADEIVEDIWTQLKGRNF